MKHTAPSNYLIVVAIAVIIVALLFVATNIGQVFGGEPDPCTLVPDPGSSTWFGPVSSLKNCWNSITFSAQRSADTLENLRKLVDYYAFTDIVKDSGAPWNVQVDLEAGLNAIESKDYLYDYDFHSDLVTLFGGLNDAHTSYRMPKPYSSVVVVRPFGLQVVNNNGQLKFYVTAPYWLDAASFAYLTTFDPTPYYGSELTAIDGTPILDWFTQFVDGYVGNFKDHAIRFNSALQVYGAFNLFDGAYFSITDLSDTVIMTLNGTDVEVPYVAELSDGLTDTADAVTKIDTPPPPPPQKRSAGSFDRQPDIHRERKSDLSWVKPAKDTDSDSRKRFDYAALNTQAVQKRSEQQSEQFILSVKTGDLANIKVFDRADDDAIWWGSYTTTGGQVVPYLRIESFSPADAENFTGILTAFSNYVSTNQIDQIIVDVSANGGGKICLAYQATTIFSEKFRGVSNYERYDLRRTNSNADLVDAGALSGYEYRKISNGDLYYEDNSWFDSRLVTRGGQSTSLTQQFYYPAGCVEYMSNIAVTHFPADPIIITDGTCGSACSLFTTKFVENSVGRVFSYGGFPGVTMDTASFGGGNVEDWQDFVSYATYFGPTNPPKYTTTSATYRFTHHEMYSGTTSTLPREFRSIPGMYHAYFYDWLTAADPATESGQQALADLYETATYAWTLPAPVAVPIAPPVADVPQSASPVVAAPVAKPVAPVSGKVSEATSVTSQGLLISIALYLYMLM